MVRQNCQNWHLSVVLLCFLWCLAMLMTVCFKATFRRNSQLVMGRTLGKKRLLRTELHSPVAAALTHTAARLSFQLQISHQLPMRLPVFSTDLPVFVQC